MMKTKEELKRNLEAIKTAILSMENGIKNSKGGSEGENLYVDRFSKELAEAKASKEALEAELRQLEGGQKDK